MKTSIIFLTAAFAVTFDLGFVRADET